MHTHRLKVLIPEDHNLHIAVRLPEDFPAGPAELLLVLEGAATATSRQSRESRDLDVLAKMRQLEHTEEERHILDEFEEFRQTHPFAVGSLVEP